MSSTVFAGERLAWGLSLILVLARAQAADLYVSTQGSDSSPGTAAQPFRTITHAYSRAAAGTVIHVLPGVYTDYRSGWGIHLGKSGTASSPIVLRSTVRGGAIIDGGNAADRNQGLYISGSYNTVEGFEIRNGPHGGIAIYGNNNRIINNEIHHNGNPASSSGNGQDGVYSNEGTSGNFYGANSIHDNGRTGSNLDHGLYLCGRNETVINNLLYRNAATGLQVAGYATVSGMKVYNNVVAWNGTTGIILWLSLNGVDIKNNIIYRNGNYGVGSYDAHGSGVVVDHNLCFNNGGGNYNFTAGGSDYGYTLGASISADPLFVNGTSANFNPRLGSGSPAIGAGVNLSSTFTTDINGAARPGSGAWDLGAYVSTAANTAPTISAISSCVVGAGTCTPAIPFTIGDAETPASNLALSASSDNAALVTAADIVLGGSNSNRTVTVTPKPGQTGSANITVTVSDGTAIGQSVFRMSVQLLPTAPPGLHIVSVKP
ncbi:MAG TPA: right-handed parallel beta-helix repeat-containing protein [Candidatus Paceibacterota bacterium]|nr:right-handed parallel beta-helix repeat-containing protein [Candidatus Paceibacterota bacterium]